MEADDGYLVGTEEGHLVGGEESQLVVGDSHCLEQSMPL